MQSAQKAEIAAWVAGAGLDGMAEPTSCMFASV